MVGNNFGWSSFASLQFLEGTAGFSVTKGEFSLVESLLAFGAAVSCLPTGYVMDKFGRKKVLLGLAPIFLLGWCLLIWANSVSFRVVLQRISF